jgi:hypothetical protein
MRRLFDNMKVAGSSVTFEPAGAMPTEAAVLIEVSNTLKKPSSSQ